MPNITAPPNRLVAVLVYDGLCTFEFGIAAEIFGLPRPEMGEDWYRMISCAVETGPLAAVGGLHVAAEAGLDMLEEAGTIVVPGWRGAEIAPPTHLLEALKSAAAGGTRVVPICSGAFVLAAAGLLDGRNATTHWRYVDAFRSAYPHLRLVPEVLYVDEGQVLTSAGSAAGIDLLLHIVRADFGPDAANAVARRLVMPPHRDGGQAQFIMRPVPAQPNGRLAPLLDLMRERLERPMPVAALAKLAAMSERTFLRRFKELTGMTPARWLLHERLAEAKRLLEEGRMGVEAVAAAAGLGTAATMRMHFRNHVGVGPTAYRRQFCRESPSHRARAGSRV